MASALSEVGGDETIAATIRNEVIPRLMLAFKDAAPVDESPWAPYGAAPDVQAVDAVARLALDGDERGASVFVSALIDNGVALETVFLDVLAPAARQIGAAWESDERGFAEVSAALVTLHGLFRSRQLAFQADVDAAPQAPAVLIAPTPGEHHILGALIVEAFFKRAGWRVDSGRFDAIEGLIDTVRAQAYDVVGLSVGRTAVIDECRDAIRALRAASANPDVAVLVGGEGVARAGATAADLGADAVAIDAPAAVNAAESLCMRVRGGAVA